MPVFIVILFGALLKRIRILNDNFIDVSTRVVFIVALPALLFREISGTDFAEVFDVGLMAFIITVTVISFAALCVMVPLFVKKKSSAGAFIQGCFRSNFAFLGMPLIFTIFGQAAVSRAAIVLSFLMPVYNVMAVVLLTVTSPTDVKYSGKSMLRNIITNPLILAVIVALPFSFFKLRLPDVLSGAIGFMADFSTPLALLCIGATINFENFRINIRKGIMAALIKVALLPAAAVTAAYLLGFSGDRMGIIFILFASPTAISSFIMAKAMGSDAELASNIVVTSTLLSAFTIFAGVLALKTFGLI